MKQETKQATETRSGLFQDRGWVFVTPLIVPELRDVGVVQAFAATRPEYTHRVKIEDHGLRCTCPGWRKHAKCWHVHWALKHNIGAEWAFGTYLDRMPLKRELAELDANDAWTSWLREHMAVVGLDHRPPTTPSSFGLGKTRRRCAQCSSVFRVCRGGAGYKYCSKACSREKIKVRKRSRRRRERCREWPLAKVVDYLVILEEEWARRIGLTIGVSG